MQIIYFKDLAFSALQVINELTEVYTNLRESANKENDLWTFASADMTLATLKDALYMLNQPFYRIYACYLCAEPTDTIEEMTKERMIYSYNRKMC